MIRQGKLSDNQIALLENLGFRWNPRDFDYALLPPGMPSLYTELPLLTWQESYENLQVFKGTYGHCEVPHKFEHILKLGTWVVHIHQRLILYTVDGAMN
jgi:Helicase associated domain